MLLRHRKKLEIKNSRNNDPEGHGAAAKADSLLQKTNKLQQVLQHQRDQLGKGMSGEGALRKKAKQAEGADAGEENVAGAGRR